MLTKYRHHLSVIRDCIDKNQVVIKKMLSDNPLCDNSVVTQRDLDGHASKIRHQDMEHVSLQSVRVVLYLFCLLLASESVVSFSILL